MRIPLRTLVGLLVPAAVTAQGTIIPGPCPASPPPCRDGRCVEVPIRPCPPGNPVVLVASAVRADLDDRVVRYEVNEVFVNRGPGLGEADFIFPLPPGAAFEDLRLSIDGELVAGETMNASDARRVYEDIVRRRRDPALVEWMGSAMLRAHIFPLNPGEEKRVVVRFQAVAPREGDAVRIDYARGTVPPGRATPPVMRAGDDEPGDSFILTYPTADGFGAPYSPTHVLRFSDRAGRRTVRASGESREVTILLPLRRTDRAALSVLAHRPDPDSGGFALITVTPPPATARAIPRDLTFVVDVSGSMRGQKLDQAKAAGRRLLASLHPGDRFRLVDFSTDVREFRDGFVAATPENLRAATAYLDGLVAEGSTNISGALDAALDGGTVRGHLPLVVFVTDGEPTVGERNADAIAALAARRRGESRVFTVGVGTGVNAALVEQLAVEGHGTAHFVRNDESVERAISLLASRLSMPVLTEVRIAARGVRLRQAQPAFPVDIFAGQDLVVLARYDGSGVARVTVEGRGAAGPVTWSTTASFPVRERANAFIPRLWAAQRLGWLAAEKRKAGATPELDAEIASLGARYGIPTEFSSYLVLEPGARDIARRGDVLTASAGVPMPGALKAAANGGNQSAGPPAAEARFESARQAAARRDTRSLADLDAASLPAGTRLVGNRRFRERNGVWTDLGYTDSVRVVNVKAYSPLYFELADRLPGMRDILALGDAILACGRTVAIEVGTTGLERMSEGELAVLQLAW
jgi:Ca-activated chloride channel family protein